MSNFQARQGDIFFEVVKTPKGKKQKISNILAYGEVTGHTHRIMNPSMEELESVVDENGDIYVMNPRGQIEIGHEEHGTVMLPQNEWICITRQREYDPSAAIKERQVRD
jgi:hypothetical protein